MHLREAIARHYAKDAQIPYESQPVKDCALEYADIIMGMVKTFLDHNMTEKIELSASKQTQILNLLEEEHMP